MAGWGYLKDGVPGVSGPAFDRLPPIHSEPGLGTVMSSEIEKLERRWQENPLGLTFAPLAEAYRKAGDPAKALELLENGLTQHPNYVPAHIVRGRCHVDTEASEAAEQAFRRVVELDPENVIALKSLAELAEGEGRIAEACALLRNVLEVDRNNDEARDQLERLTASSSPSEVPAQPGQFVPRSFTPEDLNPEPSEDYQLSEDPLALSPGDGRIPEIVLQEETLERSLPVVEAAQGRDTIAAPDPDAAKGMSTLQLDSEFAPEAEATERSEPFDEPAPETAEILNSADSSALEAAWEPVSEAPPPEPAVLEPEPEEPVSEPELATVSPEPELVVTETMAEIFLRQGHRELALAVYTQLAQRDPGNQRVAAAASRLQEELAPPPPPAPPPAPEPPRFDASTTGGRSVADWFNMLLSAPRPTPAPAIHPPAFEASRPSGEPTRPASDTLSLSAVFGEDAAPARPAGAPPPPPGTEPSFEQFFAAGQGTSEVELPKPPATETPALSAMAPEDLEQFNAWLRGLKR